MQKWEAEMEFRIGLLWRWSVWGQVGSGHVEVCGREGVGDDGVLEGEGLGSMRQ